MTARLLSRRDFSRFGGVAAVEPWRPLAADAGAPTTNTLGFAIVRAWADAWGEPSPEALVQLYAPGGVYEDVPFGLRVTGDDLRTTIQARFEQVTDPQREPRQIVSTDTWAVAVYDFTGRNQGFFPQAPIGAGFTIPMLTIFVFRGGLIARSADYYDRTAARHAATWAGG